MAKLIVAGGCFWGVQEALRRLDGVSSTSVGYAQSRIVNPSYEVVCSGTSGATEACEVEYDSDAVLIRVLDRFFAVIDPFALNRQGNDIGTQYRTGIYWTSPEQQHVVKAYAKQVEARLGRKIAVELRSLDNYYRAEIYHQDYLRKNPHGYCHINLEAVEKEK